MPRIIRRRPLAERLKAYLNPLDFLLWLSQEIDAHDWDQLEKDWALPIGLALNVVFLVARANSTASRGGAVDDVFGEETGVPWLSWLATFVVHILATFSVLNTVYTFYRTRHYRMFEASIDETPPTLSAHRVRVNSSPMSSSPIRYLANKLMPGSAYSRAHPDAQRDVWELAVWDPLHICLRLFCLFSPGHVLVYMHFLPTQLSDPRPSVTLATSIFLATLLSIQMTFLTSSFTRQSKDNALVHKEVLREYDIKYVHPRTRLLMRDVSTQYSASNASHPGSDSKHNEVEVFTPTVIVNHGFKTSPNPNYVSYVDPEGLTPKRQTPTLSTPGVLNSIRQHPSLQTSSHERDSSPVVRTSNAPIRQPQFRPAPPINGDGGSLGVYSHANSPLRRGIISNVDRHGHLSRTTDFNYNEHGTTPIKRLSSPLKSSFAGNATARLSHLSARRETGRF